jgi:hypothetical protein
VTRATLKFSDEEVFASVWEFSSNSRQMIKSYLPKRNNPGELLVLAAFFSIPAVVALLQNRPFLFPSFGNKAAQITLWSPKQLHILGWFGAVVAALLVVLYFCARWSIAREEKSPPQHFMEL